MSNVIDLFTDTAAILDSIVSDIYYGMLRGKSLNTEQMIRNDQQAVQHMQCNNTQWPCKTHKDRPASHVLLRETPLAALVRV